MAIKVFIDQGHNPYGFNAGAEGFGAREQDITYIVGAYLANILAADYRFEAAVSRQTPDEILGYDTNSSLRERVDMANTWGRTILSASMSMPMSIRRSTAQKHMSTLREAPLITWAPILSRRSSAGWAQKITVFM